MISLSDFTSPFFQLSPSPQKLIFPHAHTLVFLITELPDCLSAPYTHHQQVTTESLWPFYNMSCWSSHFVLPAQEYNRLIIDHDATEKAKAVLLKQDYLPGLFKILENHGVADLVEPHLLHRHFLLREGETLVHKQLNITRGIRISVLMSPRPWSAPRLSSLI
ncbi:hypothetical protein VTK73DRAFT_700 [Phialemonium thermophilum]|uniref:Uncharacterized protein n=1 Tax=Phialemonium thermophilum TaxID=223376 RepID=A0ABR3VUJ3_9PEZI